MSEKKINKLLLTFFSGITLWALTKDLSTWKYSWEKLSNVLNRLDLNASDLETVDHTRCYP